MQGAEIEVCEGFLLLGREAEGLGGRRQDGLESSELAVEVADIHGLFDWRQERRFYFLGQQGFPVDGLQDKAINAAIVSYWININWCCTRFIVNQNKTCNIPTHYGYKLMSEGEWFTSKNFSPLTSFASLSPAPSLFRGFFFSSCRRMIQLC